MYALVNSNPEGYNFLGIFDSRQKAEQAGRMYRHYLHQETADLYKDDSEQMEKALETDDWWHKL